MSTKTYSKVTLRPYLEEKQSNMGLEKYQMVVFEGAKHDYEMAAVEEGGILRYINGVNPFSPEITVLNDEEREAAEIEIKRVLIEAEKKLAGNVIKEDDPDWFNKVKKVRPNNIEFWSSPDMKLSLANSPIYLEPSKNILDLLKYRAIKAGGWPEVATSLTDARNRSVAPKFYLDELEETIAIKTEVTKLRYKAGAELGKLLTGNGNKLLYVCKIIDDNCAQYKKNTPLDIMFENMSKFIEGELVEKDKRKTASTFLDVVGQNMETLKLRAVIKDASFYKLIAVKGDGLIYEMETATPLGKNPSQVLEYLKNPLNEDVMKRLMERAEKFWNQ